MTAHTTHYAGCENIHHRCALRQLGHVETALREALAEFRTAESVAGSDYFTARVHAGLLDEWHRALERTATPPGVTDGGIPPTADDRRPPAAAP